MLSGLKAWRPAFVVGFAKVAKIAGQMHATQQPMAIPAIAARWARIDDSRARGMSTLRHSLDNIRSIPGSGPTKYSGPTCTVPFWSYLAIGLIFVLSLKFSRVWPIFIWCARTDMAFCRRVARYEDPTILYYKRLLVNDLQYVSQCLVRKRAVLKSIYW